MMVKLGVEIYFSDDALPAWKVEALRERIEKAVIDVSKEIYGITGISVQARNETPGDLLNQLEQMLADAKRRQAVARQNRRSGVTFSEFLKMIPRVARAAWSERKGPVRKGNSPEKQT